MKSIIVSVCAGLILASASFTPLLAQNHNFEDYSWRENDLAEGGDCACGTGNCLYIS